MKCFSCIFRRKESDTNAVETEDMQNVRVFTYKELKKYTEDFSWANKIGEGGFGFVYRGKLRDGKLVAIKVLSSESRQGAREFLTELNMISSVEHDNLVKLYGCCIEADNRILVYDYLENNSLAQTLLAGGQSDLQFTWQARMKICIGVARGLAYLHEEVQPHIVHRDIKASNILLDKDLNPKISDFGLAKLIPADMTHVSTRVAGTVGYLAPEYAIRGRLTRKADIYSFGVLLLEIVSGRSNSKLATEEHFLLERSADITHGVILLQTWMLHEQNALLMIVDPNLNGYFNEEEACRLLKVGLLCTQDNPKLRPYMSTIVKMLTGEQDVDQSPITKPGLIEDLTELKIRSQRHQRGSESILSITASSGPDTAMAESSSHAFLSLR